MVRASEPEPSKNQPMAGLSLAGARGIEPRSRVLETLILAVVLCPYGKYFRCKLYHLTKRFSITSDHLKRRLKYDIVRDIQIFMKHLQLSPPLLIITMGYPGSGKSFFARQFAELYNLPRVSEDRIRFELFEKPFFNDDEADIIHRISTYMLEQLMQTERTIVCEGSFLTIKERKIMENLAVKNGYRLLVVWLQTDLETSAQRAATRDRRNPDSKYAFEVERSTFNSIKDTLQRPTEKETFVVVSGKHAYKSQCLTVLRKIAGIYSDSVSKGEFGVPGTPTISRPKNPPLRPSQRFVQ